MTALVILWHFWLGAVCVPHYTNVHMYVVMYMFERCINYDDDLMWWHILRTMLIACTHDHYRRHGGCLGCGRWEDCRLLRHVWSLVWRKWTHGIPWITYFQTQHTQVAWVIITHWVATSTRMSGLHDNLLHSADKLLQYSAPVRESTTGGVHNW